MVGNANPIIDRLNIMEAQIKILQRQNESLWIVNKMLANSIEQLEARLPNKGVTKSWKTLDD